MGDVERTMVFILEREARAFALPEEHSAEIKEIRGLIREMGA